MGVTTVDAEQARKLLSIAKWELQKYLMRYVAWMGFFVRRAARAGVYIAVSSDVYYTSEGACIDLTLRLQETSLDGRKTKWWMETRAKIAEKLIEYVKRKLRDEGIKVAVDKSVNVSSPAIPRHRESIAPESIKIGAKFGITGIDATMLFSSPDARKRRVYESRGVAGEEKPSDLKALEAEVVDEYERGVESGGVEEALGAAEEGGGGEEREAGGLDIISHREALERGCLKASEAAVKYGVPLMALIQLARDGVIRGYHGVDAKGEPAFYVVEEDVKAVAKYFKPEG
jgi:hypothetical protein